MWDLEVNLDKFKVVIVGKGGNKMNRGVKCVYDGKEVKTA